jgi:hypothetical protein
MTEVTVGAVAGGIVGAVMLAIRSFDYWMANRGRKNGTGNGKTGWYPGSAFSREDRSEVFEWMGNVGTYVRGNQDLIKAIAAALQSHERDEMALLTESKGIQQRQLDLQTDMKEALRDGQREVVSAIHSLEQVVIQLAANNNNRRS